MLYSIVQLSYQHALNPRALGTMYYKYYTDVCSFFVFIPVSVDCLGRLLRYIVRYYIVELRVLIIYFL